jgi:hypothetical protein
MTAMKRVQVRTGTHAAGGGSSAGDPSESVGKRNVGGEPDGGEVRPIGFSLSGDVEFQYEVIGAGAASARRPTRVRVLFPAGARATLETLSWGKSTSIVETLDRLCRRAITRLGIAGECAEGSVEIGLTASAFRADLKRIMGEPLRLVPPVGQ